MVLSSALAYPPLSQSVHRLLHSLHDTYAQLGVFIHRVIHKTRPLWVGNIQPLGPKLFTHEAGFPHFWAIYPRQHSHFTSSRSCTNGLCGIASEQNTSRTAHW